MEPHVRPYFHRPDMGSDTVVGGVMSEHCYNLWKLENASGARCHDAPVGARSSTQAMMEYGYTSSLG